MMNDQTDVCVSRWIGRWVVEIIFTLGNIEREESFFFPRRGGGMRLFSHGKDHGRIVELAEERRRRRNSRRLETES